MGTASRASPVIRESSESGRQKLQKLQNFVRSKEGQKTTRFCLKTSLILLPNGQSKIPLYYGFIYGCKILKYAKVMGTPSVIKDIFLLELQRKTIKDFSESVWDSIEEHLIEDNADRPLVKFSEIAFTQAMTEIMIEGAGAI